MDYDALLSEYERLKKENARLQAENLSLHKRLQQNEALTPCKLTSSRLFTTQQIHTTVNHKSPASQKIELFLSLFSGRPDVYARRWVNHKKGTSGYSPACAHEWHKGFCLKPKVKCTACRNQKFYPYDRELIKAHLLGQVEAGVYPLLEDETCYFLAIDFDKGNWQENIVAFREACKDWCISCEVERSRSGNGAHVWFFFETAIPSTLARKFGSVLLTYAMSKNYQVGLDSYDRLFPNQDTLPRGGLGNLIALPLQKEARGENNSVFVDDNFIPYPDQWALLSNIGKLSMEEIEKYIAKIAGSSELGILMQDDASGDTYLKPWMGNRDNLKVDNTQLPPHITVSQANMLYIPKKELPSKALNQITRIAAFNNPEFYKRQSMRLPIYNCPRVIHLEENLEDYIAIPRGCKDKLLQFFEEYNINVVLQDETNPGKPIKVSFIGELTELQKEAGKALLNHEYGVLSAPPGFGKTILGAWLIGKRKVNTLILVHLKHLLDQWKDRLKQFLNIEEILAIEVQQKRGRPKKRSLIGDLSGGKDRRSGLIDVALIQSLCTKDEDKVVNHCLQDYGMVIVDECHHISAFTFEKVIKAAHARYVYGLTATPTRQDGHHPIIFMHCGPIRYKVDARSQSEKRPFDHTVLPRFTSFKMPPKNDNDHWHIQKIYTGVTLSETRNQMIIEDVLKAVADERSSIILAHRTAHVDKLADMLREKGVNVLVLTGRLKDRQRKEIRNQLEKSTDNPPPVIVATGKYIGEGFDYAPLDTLFLAFPVAWHGTVQQYIGRLHRLYQQKKDVRVIDYVDIHEYVLERMYHKRLKAYTASGYTIKSPDLEGKEVEVLYNKNDYWDIYSKDIMSCCDRIIIASPFMNQRQIDKMIALLKTVMVKGVQVTVLTRPVSDYKEIDTTRVSSSLESIKNTGINIVFKEKISQRFTVIDHRIVWYGSINFLGYSNKEANIMRLDNRDLAVEIAETIRPQSTM